MGVVLMSKSDVGPLGAAGGKKTDCDKSTTCTTTELSTIINEGVKLETWLVGLQHKLLLGVAPTGMKPPDSKSARQQQLQLQLQQQGQELQPDNVVPLHLISPTSSFSSSLSTSSPSPLSSPSASSSSSSSSSSSFAVSTDEVCRGVDRGTCSSCNGVSCVTGVSMNGMDSKICGENIASGGGGGSSRSSSGVARPMIAGRKRPLYEMLDSYVEKAQDLAERACFHPDFFQWQYMSRLIISFLFFSAAGYINALATVTSTYRNPYALLYSSHDGEPLDGHTLPDLGHDLWAWILNALSYGSDYIEEAHLPDLLVVGLFKVTLVFTLLHPRRFLIMRRFFIISGIILLMRAVSVSVTVLPDASPTCRAKARRADGSFQPKGPLFPDAFLAALHFTVAPTSMVTCGDMIFSGHTSSLMMFAMIFRKYCRAKHLQTRVFFREWMWTERVCTLIRKAVYIYTAAGACVIVGSKLHYTLDVLLAVLLVYWTFHQYHHWVKYVRLHAKRKTPVLLWLEADHVLGLDNQAYLISESKKAI